MYTHHRQTAARFDAHARCAPGLMLALLAFALLPGDIAAQHTTQPPMPAGFDEPMPLYSAGLGTFARRITTRSREAQLYFDQGVQLLYSFAPEEAARSFREAWNRDPQCAMCYFGEAWAWGPYLNGEMSGDDAPRAFAAIEQAKRLAPGHTTNVERALIDAMATRYEPTHDAKRREQLDTLYSKAIADVYERFPSDLDAGTLYAESLMLLEPRRGNWDLASTSVQRIHFVLETLLAQDIAHPGACHLYIHATESTVRPGKAEACAEHLGRSIPGASHINHMPSHTFNRVGRWGDAVRANIDAWHSDLKAAVGEGFAIYPSHNLHMLLFAASYDGQGAVAIQAARDYRKVPGGGEYYHVLAMVRFGRFDEILELEVPAVSNPIFQGLIDFGRGYAHLRLGHGDSARALLDRIDSAATASPASTTFRGHPANALLGITGGILRAELLRDEQHYDEAITALEQAVALEDGLRYDEPEPLNFSARHWLGAVLLDAGLAADAERIYREDLAKHPRNGWSLFGLEQSIRAQNRRAEADDVQRQFRDAWSRSDAWIRASRY
jgi:tetratricopeptide (TPR) repeat protein